MSDSTADANDKEPVAAKPSRRELIAGIAALVAGAAVSQSQQAAASHGAAFIVDATNAAHGTSTLAVANLSAVAKRPGLDIRQQGAGIALHAEAGAQTNFAVLVSNTATIGVSVLGSPGLVAGTGFDRTAMRNNVFEAGDWDAGIVAFSNNADAPAIRAFHTPDMGLFTPTGTSAALHTYSAESEGVSALFEHGDGGIAVHAKGDVVIEGNLISTGSGVPALCRRFTVPTGSRVFNFDDADIDPTMLLFGAFNGAAGTLESPVFPIHFIPKAGRASVVFNSATMRPTPLTVLGFRPCPMSE
jgi:hypothetical protein